MDEYLIKARLRKGSDPDYYIAKSEEFLKQLSDMGYAQIEYAPYAVKDEWTYGVLKRCRVGGLAWSNNVRILYNQQPEDSKKQYTPEVEK